MLLNLNLFCCLLFNFIRLLTASPPEIPSSGLFKHAWPGIPVASPIPVATPIFPAMTFQSNPSPFPPTSTNKTPQQMAAKTEDPRPTMESLGAFMQKNQITSVQSSNQFVAPTHSAKSGTKKWYEAIVRGKRSTMTSAVDNPRTSPISPAQSDPQPKPEFAGLKLERPPWNRIQVQADPDAFELRRILELHALRANIESDRDIRRQHVQRAFTVWQMYVSERGVIPDDKTFSVLFHLLIEDEQRVFGDDMWVYFDFMAKYAKPPGFVAFAMLQICNKRNMDIFTALKVRDKVIMKYALEIKPSLKPSLLIEVKQIYKNNGFDIEIEEIRQIMECKRQWVQNPRQALDAFHAMRKRNIHLDFEVTHYLSSVFALPTKIKPPDTELFSDFITNQVHGFDQTVGRSESPPDLLSD